MSKIVTFNKSTNNKKECPGTHKPIFPKDEFSFEYYLNNYNIPGNVCHPDFYVIWNKDLQKYCCSKNASTLEEMIEKCDELIDAFENTVSNNMKPKYEQKISIINEKRKEFIEELKNKNVNNKHFNPTIHLIRKGGYKYKKSKIHKKLKIYKKTKKINNKNY